MQAALEVTARYCGRELEQYGQCVAAKPESWQRDCHYLKMSIAQCTSSHPIIRQIRQACAQPFEAFEECLRQNEAAVGNCAEHMRRFLQCAEQVQLPRSPATVEVFPFLTSGWPHLDLPTSSVALTQELTQRKRIASTAYEFILKPTNRCSRLTGPLPTKLFLKTLIPEFSFLFFSFLIIL
ncbi:coiled-coil-helix-coiled-coil-helix domain-containing protein 5 isoform X1 [Pan paniscus]|uniref:coiled-coil-helix-coiled-coil-helix domain-containing protein 5 isoform X1 n=1 Tax=Pan paniscus TaxID=9597 RepID=UPI00155FAF3E|nr:coiled-coil-helix-coiled-coil-helix domain-containing protein 5 isoform X1 [Pan paniscus]